MVMNDAVAPLRIFRHAEGALCLAAARLSLLATAK